MSDPRPDNLISTNELFYEIERARRTPFKNVMVTLQRCATAINYFEERLELRTKDYKLLPESCDGIGCREATIQQLEARIAKLQLIIKGKTFTTEEPLP